MSVETIAFRPDQEVGEAFQEIWQSNYADVSHPAIEAGIRTVEDQSGELEGGRLYITDVTLRDGQQQRTETITTEQRVEVFDRIVETGVDRIEIGHLGNSNGDQQLAGEIVCRVAEKEVGDERYGRVKLQVLFGSQENLIQDGVSVLETAFQENYGEKWRKEMADKVIVHVYDRLDENLRSLSRQPYSAEKSAQRICTAAEYAIDAGFTQFSVSGEGATAETPETAIQFHRSINDYLFAHGAESINVNLANTFGFSTSQKWSKESLAVFNTAVKHGYEAPVTTSIHAHNDVNSAIDYSMDAVVAGFDRVEGTHTGMGERVGNVATVDVVARFLEQARHEIADRDKEENRHSNIVKQLGVVGLQRTVQLDTSVANNFDNWHKTGEAMSDIFGPHARYRWERTALGNPYAFDNGSGPHDQAMAAAVENPLEKPPYENYEWFLTVASVLGRGEARQLAIGNPEAVDTVTVGNHAAGGKSKKIKEGTLERPGVASIERADERFNAFCRSVVGLCVEGVSVRR